MMSLITLIRTTAIMIVCWKSEEPEDVELVELYTRKLEREIGDDCAASNDTIPVKPMRRASSQTRIVAAAVVPPLREVSKP